VRLHHVLCCIAGEFFGGLPGMIVSVVQTTESYAVGHAGLVFCDTSTGTILAVAPFYFYCGLTPAQLAASNPMYTSTYVFVDKF
jgi:hypothetical protein